MLGMDRGWGVKMKNVNNVLIKRVNYLSIAILTITLLGIVSISIATDYAVQAYNIQATSNSLVDLSFFGDYELYQNFSPEAFTFETSLPITHVFISHKTFASACFISTYENVYFRY